MRIAPIISAVFPSLVQRRISRSRAVRQTSLAQFSRGKEQKFDDKAKAEFKKNWAMMLDGLKTAAEAH